MNCGLLGRTLGHSYSPRIHSQLGDYSYVLFEKEPEELETFLRHGDFTGLNVTIPYKKTVIPFLDELSDTARRLGAVNTVVRQGDRLLGHNTDYFGFASMVSESGLSPKGKKCLVLGSGGASATVCAVLEELGAQVVVISRRGENHYGNLSIHGDAAILVNTTPVGMYPDTLVSPVDLGLFPNLEGVLDLIYNPARTQLLMDAESRGLVAMNGLWMLVAQAWEAARMFTGQDIPQERIDQIYRTLKLQMENIILIGMPGAGKSTIGVLLAKSMLMDFVDTDLLIQKKCAESLCGIIAAKGIEEFLKIENDVICENDFENSVVATGGSAVYGEEAMAKLCADGVAVYLKLSPEELVRRIDNIHTRGIAMKEGTSIADLYAERAPLYEKYADITVECEGLTPEQCVDMITKACIG